MASLTEYAARRAKPPCKACSLPPKILEQVDAGIKEGLPLSLISKWLRSEGHEVGRTTVERHRDRCLDVQP